MNEYSSKNRKKGEKDLFLDGVDGVEIPYRPHIDILHALGDGVLVNLWIGFAVFVEFVQDF